MTKKTLLLSEIFPPTNGGSGRWFWELYTRLPQDQYVIAADNAKNDEAFDETHSLNLHRLDLSSTSWGLKSLKGLYYYWRVFFHVRRIIENEKITHIHCGRCLPEGFIGYLLNLFLGLSYVCYIHGEDVETAATSRELSWIVRKALNSASKLICNSQNTANLVLNDWQVPSTKVVILNPACDTERFVPAEKNINTKTSLGWGNRKIILTVGRLQQRKGHDMLIKTLPLIAREFPDILYAIVGDGKEKAKLQTLTKTLSLENNVLFMSEISDQQMIQAYQQCDVFVLPNRRVDQDIEGFGMVLVEAQACEKPVIAGDSGGTAETMLPGKTGYIVDCTNSEVMAKQICSLLKDEQLCKEMGKQARIHVEKSLDWKVHTEKAKQIFKLQNL
jgi:phosphatidyl-myo-inositol dimannoside synthase